MKADIHPQWFAEAKVTCACGNTFITGSTMQTIKVDICSNCHPLFTGQQKLVDTLGQVERFQKKSEKSSIKVIERKKILDARSAKVTQEKKEKPSLKDLLMQARKSAVS
ncbi:50S ribosomal protein L31 [Candidatus Daviesbacteria bacterium]|nr:50S ribosomal protein L31 [Candidatus Daviesbacteria bacterium]